MKSTGNSKILGGYGSKGQSGTRVLMVLLILIGLSVLSTVAAHTSFADAFVPTGSMSSHRIDHATTLLQNGKVLIVGGWDGTQANAGPVDSAEIFDPVTGTFTPTGNMALSRQAHTATLLPNGKVLIAGGDGGATGLTLDTAEIYNPVNGTFVSTGGMDLPRLRHTATVLPNGKVLIAGGTICCSGFVYNYVEIYDPATETFTPTGNMTSARHSHTATLLANGNVLIVGGYGPNSIALNSAEIYDLTTGTFLPTGNMTSPREFHSATLLPDGKVLVAGGAIPTNSLNSAEIFDPTTETFLPTGNMTAPRAHYTSSILPNGKVLIAGGFSSGNVCLNSAEIYDSGTGIFTLSGNMASQRRGHTATLLPSGGVLIAGGSNGNGAFGLNSAEIYNYQPYTLTDLGTLGGGSSGAFGINNNGEVVGQSGIHAFLYSHGTMTDLGTLGGSDSFAFGINNNGQVIGWSSPVGVNNDHAFLYSNGTMTDLGTLGGLYSDAQCINNNGQVVGGSFTASGSIHAFLYSNGTMNDLGTLGGAKSWAYGINDSGQVVGESWIAGTAMAHAFLYSNGTMTDLGTLGGTWSQALGINNNGQVVGQSKTTGDVTVRGFLYSNGTMTDLGTLGGTQSYALRINNNGQVIGGSTISGDVALHQVLYSNGTMTDLTQIVDAMGVSGFTAKGINDLGQIVGFGRVGDNDHAILLTPATPTANTVFTITATAAPNGSISPSGTNTITSGQSLTFAITANPGYRVADVLVDGVSVGAVTTYAFSNVTADHTIAATFAVNSVYTISASAGAGGTISPAGSVFISGGQSQSFSIAPAAGYRVLDVMVDGASVGAVTTYTFTNVTADHAIAATFTTDVYVLSASASGSGAISPSGDTTVGRGSVQTYAITPAQGWHVLYVRVDGTNVGAPTSYTFSNITMNHTIDVKFVPDTYIITATAGANGSLSPAGAINVNVGATPTFSITPSAGYFVANVLVDGVAVGAVSSYTFPPVNEPHTISATFSASPIYTITASAGANGSITPSGATPMPGGTSKTFTITPAAGYRVGDVRVDGSSVGARTSYYFRKVTADHTISATFIPDVFSITASVKSGNGSISPAGTITVNRGGSQTYSITPAPGWRVLYVWVDTYNKGALTEYTFTNVTYNRTIQVYFVTN